MIPSDVAEALLGHEEGLTEVYRKYEEKDLAEFYKKGESALMVFGNGQDLAKLRVEIDEKNKQLQELVTGLTSDNMVLRTRLQMVEDKLQSEKTLRENTEKASNDTVDKLIAKIESLQHFIDTSDQLNSEDFSIINQMIQKYRERKLKQEESKQIQ